jgi:hypothetical protein
MQTSDIFNVIERFPNVKEKFMGVFPCDLIPKQMDQFTCLIFNLSKSGEKGTHWNALIRNYNNSQQAVYEIFDPLSTNFAVLNPYLNFKNATYYFNSQSFQDPESSICGLMSIYFLIARMHDIYVNYNEILSEIFEPDVKQNTQIVMDFFKDFV